MKKFLSFLMTFASVATSLWAQDDGYVRVSRDTDPDDVKEIKTPSKWQVEGVNPDDHFILMEDGIVYEVFPDQKLYFVGSYNVEETRISIPVSYTIKGSEYRVVAFDFNDYSNYTDIVSQSVTTLEIASGAVEEIYSDNKTVLPNLSEVIVSDINAYALFAFNEDNEYKPVTFESEDVKITIKEGITFSSSDGFVLMPNDQNANSYSILGYTGSERIAKIPFSYNSKPITGLFSMGDDLNSNVKVLDFSGAQSQNMDVYVPIEDFATVGVSDKISSLLTIKPSFTPTNDISKIGTVDNLIYSLKDENQTATLVGVAKSAGSNISLNDEFNYDDVTYTVTSVNFDEVFCEGANKVKVVNVNFAQTLDEMAYFEIFENADQYVFKHANVFADAYSFIEDYDKAVLESKEITNPDGSSVTIAFYYDVNGEFGDLDNFYKIIDVSLSDGGALTIPNGSSLDNPIVAFDNEIRDGDFWEHIDGLAYIVFEAQYDGFVFDDLSDYLSVPICVNPLREDLVESISTPCCVKDDVVYLINGTSLSVVGYVGQASALAIPSSIRFTLNGQSSDFEVTEVSFFDDYGFAGNANVTTIEVDHGVTIWGVVDGNEAFPNLNAINCLYYDEWNDARITSMESPDNTVSFTCQTDTIDGLIFARDYDDKTLRVMGYVEGQTTFEIKNTYTIDDVTYEMSYVVLPYEPGRLEYVGLQPGVAIGFELGTHDIEPNSITIAYGGEAELNEDLLSLAKVIFVPSEMLDRCKEISGGDFASKFVSADGLAPDDDNHNVDYDSESNTLTVTVDEDTDVKTLFSDIATAVNVGAKNTENIVINITADIDLSTTDSEQTAPGEWNAIGTAESPFTGTLSGNGFTLSGLASAAGALFGVVGNEGRIDSLFVDATVSVDMAQAFNGPGLDEAGQEVVSNWIGLLAGVNNGTMSDIFAVVDVDADFDNLSDDALFSIVAENNGVLDHVSVVLYEGSVESGNKALGSSPGQTIKVGQGGGSGGSITKCCLAKTRKLMQKDATVTYDVDECDPVEVCKELRVYDEDSWASGEAAYWFNFGGEGYSGDFSGKYSFRNGQMVLASHVCGATVRLNYSAVNADGDVEISGHRFANLGSTTSIAYSVAPRDIEGVDVVLLSDTEATFSLPKEDNNGSVDVKLVYAQQPESDATRNIVASDDVAAVYNLAGRRVASNDMHKGLYIVKSQNGEARKIIVK